jgi:SAM-dependent methyltransferase
MTTWSHGYPADSPYTLSYQPGQAPGLLQLSCAMVGVDWSPPAHAVVADIGCGRGYTVNTLAAANPQWTVLGLDYNPAHVAEAAELAESVGLSNAVFIDADLAAMSDAELDQLPELDMVTLHGVWTWVSDAVRAGVLRLLSRRLKAGGLCYVGYNALPAFGVDAALQRVLRHAAADQHRGSSPQRVHAALQTVRALHETRPVHLNDTAMLQRITDAAAVVDSDYLAHEFLTAHWRPVFFEDLSSALAAAKLEYVGSTGLHENMPDLLFTAGQREVYEALPPGAARELVKDLCIGRRFRRDVFVRGPRRSPAALDAVELTACRALGDADGAQPGPQLGVPVGVAELGPALWPTVARTLEAGPCSLGELRRRCAPRAPTAAELAAVLCGTGQAMPLASGWRDRATADTARVCRRFNQAMATSLRPHYTDAHRYALASPVLGAGLPCGWLELMVATQDDVADAGDVDHLPDPAVLAQRLVPTADAAALKQAAAEIATLLRERWPLWRRLGVA